jgi:hypothetical protein
MARLLGLFLLLVAPFSTGGQGLPPVHPYDPGKYEAHLGYYPDKIVGQLFLDWMNAELYRKLSDAGANGDQVTFKVITAGFTNFVRDSPSLSIRVDVDGKFGGNGVINMNFRCMVDIYFAIPPASIEMATLQNLGNNTDCGSSGGGAELLQLFHLSNLLSDIVRGTVENNLHRMLMQGQSAADLAEWKANDQEWGKLISRAEVQASYCASPRWPRGFCVNIGFPALSLTNAFNSLLYSAPKPLGPPSKSRSELLATAQAFIDAGPMTPPTGAAPSYPAKTDGTRYDDDDTTIFSGLMCSAGITQGCDSVRNAQGADGTFWRSPGQVNTGTNPPTGDQLTGVLNYFAAMTKKSPAVAKASLERFLKFVAAHRTALPSTSSTPLDFGYKWCAISDPNDNCTVGAAAWMILNELARQHAITDLIPQDVHNVEAQFGYGPAVLQWESLISIPGYRSHLVGVYVQIARMLGMSSAELDNAATILSSRQPENPFYMYLLLGRDDRVLQALEPKCTIDGRKELQEWSWEAADRVEAWKKSMYWDCAFMYKLLAGPPYFEANP